MDIHKKLWGVVAAQSVDNWTEDWRVLGSSPRAEKNMEGILIVGEEYLQIIGEVPLTKRFKVLC